MQKPQMVLFDYGHTLVYEKYMDETAAWEAVLAHATENPDHVSAKECVAVYHEVHDPISTDIVSKEYEIAASVYNRTVYELLGLTFDLPEEELQCVMWDAGCPMEAMPGTADFLYRLERAGIPVALVSNLAYSEYALRHRVKESVGYDRWRFVMSSCDYGVRKPSPFLFRIARRKAGIPSQDIMFCGDNTRADIYGAANAGMQAIWYHSDLPCFYRPKELDRRPDVPHVEVSTWQQLAQMLGI